ncbi:MFS transporter [Vibrio ezurae]|uniref:Putative drug resistance transporter n=1 Tax=Vibrio ezurae NBRC 102218 TaxID=1219080 RepID=U3CG66_9VIBR|nr:MFS transporter [Vibrio ezurae]GAD80219.1 putative drug resistance transporter [Vibrio ezurae NBRC 102218]
MIHSFFQRKFYILTSLYTFTVFVSNDSFLPAIPEIAHYFGFAEGDYGTVQLGVSAFLWLTLAFQLIAGPLSDRFGRRPTLLLGATLFIVANSMVTFAPSIGWFLFWRAVTGLAICAIFAAAYAAINEHYTNADAIKALGLSATIVILAPMAGPVIGLALMKIGGWKFTFWANSVFMVLILLLLNAYMPETRKLPENGTTPSLRQNIWAIFKMSRERDFLLISISSAFCGAAFLVWITAGVSMLCSNLGLSEAEFVLYNIPVMLGLMLGNFLSAYITKDVPKTVYRMMFCSSALIPLFVFLGYVQVHHQLASEISILTHLSAPILFIVPMALFSFFRGVLNPPLTQFILNKQNTNKGSASSFMSFIGIIGSITGATVAASLSGAGNNAYYYTISAFILCALVFFLLAERSVKRSIVTI